MRRVIDSTSVSPQGIGRIFPYVFGRRRGVLGIPLRTGAGAALRLAITDSDTTFYLDDLAALQRFPDAGRGQIEGERFTWAARDLSGIALTGIVRGTESTTEVAHDLGVAVYEALDEHVYAFVENPGDFAHQSLDAVYVNGILKAAD